MSNRIPMPAIPEWSECDDLSTVRRVGNRLRLSVAATIAVTAQTANAECRLQSAGPQVVRTSFSDSAVAQCDTSVISKRI